MTVAICRECGASLNQWPTATIGRCTPSGHYLDRAEQSARRAARAAIPTRECRAWLDCGNRNVPVAQLSFRGFCPRCEAVALGGQP